MSWWTDLFKDPPCWESAEIGCLEKANASCMAAMIAGFPAGVVCCTLSSGDRHAVTWIQKDGKKIYWDPSFRKYRKPSEFAGIQSETVGPSKGIFDLAPMPVPK